MKKFFLVLIALLVLGCVKPLQVIDTTETHDKLWEEISEDLAHLYTLVDSYNKNIESERSLVKVAVEPWGYPKGKIISLKSLSKVIKYSVIKVADAKVPTKTGIVEAKIAKAIGPQGISWFAADKKYIQIPMGGHMFLSKSFQAIPWEGKKIPLYTFGAVDDEIKAIPAMKKFVLFDNLIDKAYKKITQAIEFVQKKYENSPIYIDGFTVNIGIAFSFAINFKIR